MSLRTPTFSTSLYHHDLNIACSVRAAEGNRGWVRASDEGNFGFEVGNSTPYIHRFIVVHTIFATLDHGFCLPTQVPTLPAICLQSH